MIKYDIILKKGKLVDPLNNVEGIYDVGIKDGIIIDIDQELSYTDADQVLDVQGQIVMPGVVDSHVHIVRPDSKAAGYRMLIRAGVTTAFDFRGPVNRVVEEIIPYGYGLNVGVLNGIFPGNGIKDTKGSATDIYDYINKSVDEGALGVKLLGGHFPLEPETANLIIKTANKEKAYVAYHAGSTKNGSNINGLEEAIISADGLPLHLAHVNSYCRGLINSPLEEVHKALDLLEKNPNIVSESYLSSLNGTTGDLDEDLLPKSHVTRSCLKMNNYEATKEGLGQALKDSICGLYMRIGEEMQLVWGIEAYERWVQNGYKGNICFHVNSPISTVSCAVSKNKDNRFIVDAISTDGGSIPRNCIISSGLLLVEYGAITLKDFVWKASYMPAQLFGLTNKGHLSLGADADIVVVDPINKEAKITITNGKIAMIDGYLIKQPGNLITTERAAKSLKEKSVPFKTVDLGQSIFLGGRDRVYSNRRG